MSDTRQGTTVHVGGADLFLETRGEGEPLLLLHGMTGCSGDWAFAGRDALEKEYKLIIPDARGHGRSTNPGRAFSHRRLATDMLELLDRLGLERCKAIGLSMGGNTLLHAATAAPARIEAMVIVSATMSFPEQARALMRGASVEGQPASEWEVMRARHAHGDEQIRLLWQHQRDLAGSVDDMCFAAADLARIEARTLVVYGDRDPLYPVEMGVELYRALPRSALWVVPGGGHCPVFVEAAGAFARGALEHLRG